MLQYQSSPIPRNTLVHQLALIVSSFGKWLAISSTVAILEKAFMGMGINRCRALNINLYFNAHIILRVDRNRVCVVDET